MSNTINSKITEIYDSVSQAYKRDINQYKELLEHIYTAIEQKEKVLHRIKDVITSLKKEIVTKKDRNDGVPESIDASGADEETNRNINAEATAQTKIMCLYHPDSDAVDKHRRLCSSCKWKIKAYSLKGHLNDPAVVSYLKGETKIVPNVGQPMCPLHSTKPSFNKRTGLCQYCQRKALAIGIKDRPLTDVELKMVREAVL